MAGIGLRLPLDFLDAPLNSIDDVDRYTPALGFDSRG